jgi:hypothetical protein
LKASLNIASYRIKMPLKVFVILTFALYCFGQTESLNSLSEPESIPEVTFYIQRNGKTFFLNQFSPHNDSCGNLEIRFEKPVKIRAFFKCDNMHMWSVDTILFTDSALQYSFVRTTISKDNGGNLQKVGIYCENEMDLSHSELNIPKITDIPAKPMDTSVVHLSYSIGRSVFLCNDNPTKKPELRIFDYPPGYMRREPVLNYPELSMFHYGGSVKMPTNESVRLKGFMMNYWHLLNPPEVKYGGTMKEIRERTEKPKVKRKHFLTFKPID